MADRFWKSMPTALKKPTLDELYRRLRDLDYTQVDERMAVMLNTILQLEDEDMRYNRYGDDFLIDKIKLDDLSRELTSVGELAADGEWQIINDNEHYPQEDYSTPERETDLEQSEIERRENTNLRILEWMSDVKNASEEGQSIQQVD